MPNVPKWMADLMETALGSKMPVFEVVATDWVSPTVRSIIFKGNLAALNLRPGYAVAIRVCSNAFRNYTPSFIDPEENIFQILAHIHGIGPGAHFFLNLQPGQKVPVSMARGKQLIETAANYCFFGDESTLGLACALQYHFQSLGKRFYSLLHLEKDQDDLPQALGLGAYELVQRTGTGTDIDASVHIPGFTIFDNITIKNWAQAQFILAGNGLHIQRIKKELLALGINRRQIHAQAYWLPGKVGL